MRVLDLFSGLGGWSNVWWAAGHEVFTIDNQAKFSPSLCADMLEVIPQDLPWRPDVILASPPCTGFSVASIGTHWGGGHRAYEPKTEIAELGIKLVRRTVWLIEQLCPPEGWVIENPRGVMRKLDLIPNISPEVAWLCHFGDERGKPTDLWHTLRWHPGPVCHNRRVQHDPENCVCTSESICPACIKMPGTHPVSCCCGDHVTARRGAKTGTQGRATAEERAEIPDELARSVMLAVVRP